MDFLPDATAEELMEDDGTFSYILDTYYKEYENNLDEDEEVIPKEEFAKEYKFNITLGAYMLKAQFAEGIIEELKEKDIHVEFQPFNVVDKREKEEKGKIILPGEERIN